ncbi:UDP-N-acetylmuramate dehydrogenase [Candidatus Nomurabacteria bacterium]|nr:UDP-N-acetylmuramate dehydrogenase [Candidatus Nomurabacteria bacterium]
MTTFGIGGYAAYYIRVVEPEELAFVVRETRKLRIPFRLIAGGSNVVFSDETFVGLIIHFVQNNSKIFSKKGTLDVAANLGLMKLIQSSIKDGLAGLESLSGIPGSVGGAIVGNAGAYGQSISDHLTEVQIFDGRNVRWLKKSECHFAYRDSAFKREKRKWLVLRARFKLKNGDSKKLLKKSQQIITTRNMKYNPSMKCPGSFFKNVQVKNISTSALNKIDKNKIRDGKIPAGYLLEVVGACGMKMGKIEVASFHGNLLINRGGGKFADVKKLSRALKNRVYKKFGIRLEEEVRYL